MPKEVDLEPFSQDMHIAGQCKGCRCGLIAYANEITDRLRVEVARGNSWREEASSLSGRMSVLEEENDLAGEAITALNNDLVDIRSKCIAAESAMREIVGLVKSRDGKLDPYMQIKEQKKILDAVYDTAATGLLRTAGVVGDTQVEE